MKNLLRILTVAVFVLLGPSTLYAASVLLSITGDEENTDALEIRTGHRASISVSGTFAATIELQRRCDGTNWHEVWTTTVIDEMSYVADDSCDIRLGSTAYTSGTAVVRLGVGN